MAILLEQVIKRDRIIKKAVEESIVHPSGLKRQRLSDKQKQHTFIRDCKLKSCCTQCSKSFDVVERKTTYGKKRGAKRYNVCVDCWRIKSRKNNTIRKFRWDVFKRSYILHTGRGCCFCDYSDLSCVSVFDFHHIKKSDKDFTLAVLLGFGYNLTNKKLFVKEARKCHIVCANCHRKLHSGVSDGV
ncbi:hypothetical protein LCGC14_2193760 [marine sediment metagenome]|uniref:HNH domain-containing protein n=1 Tax=marine sediment metagenome TaxID=412755 RepID=A0A0F9DIS9_9ZZZZ